MVVLGYVLESLEKARFDLWKATWR